MKKAFAAALFLAAAVSGVYAESVEKACARYCATVVPTKPGTPQFEACVNNCVEGIFVN